MKEVLKGFSVKITREDGAEFFATSGSVVFVVRRRKDAVQRKRALELTGIASCKVVPVILKVKEVKS